MVLGPVSGPLGSRRSAVKVHRPVKTEGVTHTQRGIETARCTHETAVVGRREQSEGRCADPRGAHAIVGWVANKDTRIVAGIGNRPRVEPGAPVVTRRPTVSVSCVGRAIRGEGKLCESVAANNQGGSQSNEQSTLPDAAETLEQDRRTMPDLRGCGNVQWGKQADILWRVFILRGPSCCAAKPKRRTARTGQQLPDKSRAPEWR